MRSWQVAVYRQCDAVTRGGVVGLAAGIARHHDEPYGAGGVRGTQSIMMELSFARHGLFVRLCSLWT